MRGGIVLLLAVLTAMRVPVWSDDRALWSHAVRVTPTNPRALINYGNVLADDGDEVGALFLYTRALTALGDPRRSVVRRERQRRIAQGNVARADLVLHLKRGTF